MLAQAELLPRIRGAHGGRGLSARRSARDAGPGPSMRLAAGERPPVPDGGGTRRWAGGFPRRAAPPLAVARWRVELRPASGGRHVLVHGDAPAHARLGGPRPGPSLRGSLPGDRSRERGVPPAEALPAGHQRGDHPRRFCDVALSAVLALRHPLSPHGDGPPRQYPRPPMWGGPRPPRGEAPSRRRMARGAALLQGPAADVRGELRLRGLGRDRCSSNERVGHGGRPRGPAVRRAPRPLTAGRPRLAVNMLSLKDMNRGQRNWSGPLSLQPRHLDRQGVVRSAISSMAARIRARRLPTTPRARGVPSTLRSASLAAIASPSRMSATSSIQTV